MEILLWVIGICLVIVGLIWISSVQIQVLYEHKNEKDRLEIMIRALGGLFRYRWKKPFKKNDEDTKKSKKRELPHKEKTKQPIQPKRSYVEMWHQARCMWEIIRCFLKKVTCKKWVWHTQIGTGEADQTGRVVGIAWAVKTMLVGWVSHHIRLEEAPQLDVVPEFVKKQLETHFHLIIEFKVGHAIVAIYYVLVQTRRRRKKRWSNTLSTV